MALVQCVECGSQVSSLATNCVSCGAPLSLTLSSTGPVVPVELEPTEGGHPISHAKPNDAEIPNWVTTYVLVPLFLFGLVAVPWKIINFFLGPDAEDVCDVIFADRLADKTLTAGHRALVLNDKQMCIDRMDQLEEESPEFFESLAECVVEADSLQAANRCG